LDLDDDGSTCIGLDGKMLRVGGLIPDDEFSAETHTCTKFSNIKLCVNISKQVNIYNQREGERNERLKEGLFFGGTE